MDGDFSDSYLEMCRRAALARRFRAGDWWMGAACEPHLVTGGSHRASAARVWLPSVGQLLEELKRRGWERVYVDESCTASYLARGWRHDSSVAVNETGKSLEEALLALLLRD